jgi:hypothetical protein
MNKATENDAREAAEAVGLELYKRSQDPMMRRIMGSQFVLIKPSDKDPIFNRVIKLNLTAQEVVDFCYNQHATRKVGQTL